MTTLWRCADADFAAQRVRDDCRDRGSSACNQDRAQAVDSQAACALPPGWNLVQVHLQQQHAAGADLARGLHSVVRREPALSPHLSAWNQASSSQNPWRKPGCGRASRSSVPGGSPFEHRAGRAGPVTRWEAEGRAAGAGSGGAVLCCASGPRYTYQPYNGAYLGGQIDCPSRRCGGC